MKNPGRPKFTVLELTKAAMFIALMGIGANLTAFITVGAVPLTFQTVVAILAGVLLGKKAGAFSMIGYTFIGLLGVPVFAGFQGGLHVITSPTFGFIISFTVLAYVSGLIVEKSSKRSLVTYIVACYAGLIMNYLIGVPYLYFYTQFVLEATGVTFLATALGMGPFFIKDAVLAGFAAVICPQIVRAVNPYAAGQSSHTTAS
ncbi:biotin transporter BioY [Evansella sp. LMS18]|jgi:biotin transport system substrate-specific component|uniref:biotin transporter BioY n=1 Tax=Evansella sp. LMS18 TaxID=2924033 RepID=UPI0020D18F46|nr:biotin transporter BioY [Evansella sp. LMS18]UTR11597.1 biotin transporter BioY [Evansella sp. LMS18]